MELPKSCELRQWDILYKAHTGSTSDLVGASVEFDMEIELQRSWAAEQLARLIFDRLLLEGYITTDDIKTVLEEWHEREMA